MALPAELEKEVIEELFNATTDKDKDTSQMAKKLIGVLSRDCSQSRNVLSAIYPTLKHLSSHPSWHLRTVIPPFVQIAVYNSWFSIESRKQREIWIELLIDVLHDAQIEVRELAGNALSSIIRYLLPSQLMTLRDRFIELMERAVEEKGDQKAWKERKMHAAVLGLSAIVLSHPYTIQIWLPKTMLVLATKAQMNWIKTGAIGKTIRATFGEFWRTHKNQWSEEQALVLFTSEELDALHSLSTSPSYYS